jgi:hypothetical protein
MVHVRSEAALAWQGDAVVMVKVRLAPGTHMTVWAEDSCRGPSVNSQIIPASGTYAIPLGRIGGSGNATVCLSSNDGLQALLRVLLK